jgi:hypothetical protein
VNIIKSLFVALVLGLTTLSAQTPVIGVPGGFPGVTSDGGNGIDVAGNIAALSVISSSNWQLNVAATPYNAVTDAKKTNTGAMTSGSHTLTIGSSMFAAGDVGKTISVQSAGGTANGNQPLVTTISAFTSGTQVTLAAAATQTVSAQGVIWGTDDYSSFSAWAAALPGHTGVIPCPTPGGAYLVNTAQSTRTITLGSSETISMDRSCSIYYVGNTVGSLFGGLFSYPMGTTNLYLDGLHVSGEWLNHSNINGVRQGFGDGVAVNSLNGSGTSQDVTLTNGIFENLFGMGIKDLFNNSNSNFTIKNNTFRDNADTGINLGTVNTYITSNYCANTTTIGGGCMEVSSAQSTIEGNTSVNSGYNYAMQFGGNTGGSPFTGTRVIGNTVINPATNNGCFSIGDGFTRGTFQGNVCTGFNAAQIGLTLNYSGAVLSGTNTIVGNTFVGSTGSPGNVGIFDSSSTNNTFIGNTTATVSFGLEVANANVLMSSGNTWSANANDICFNNGSTGTMRDKIVEGTFNVSTCGGGAAGSFNHGTYLYNDTGIIYNADPFTITSLLSLNFSAPQLRISAGRQFNFEGNSSQLFFNDGSAGVNPLIIQAYGNGSDLVIFDHPTINNTATTTNTDERGTLTLVSGNATYTFHQGTGTAGIWGTAPVCQIQDTSSFAHLANTSTFSVTTSTLTIGNSTNTTDTYTYICRFGT